MITSLKEFFETHSVRSVKGVARKQRRDARHAARDEQHLQKEIHKLEEIVHKKVVMREDILKDLKKCIKYYSGEAHSIEAFIVDYKIIMNDLLSDIRKLQDAVKINEKEDNKLVEKLNKLVGEIKKNYEDTMIAGFGGFESTTFSAQKLLSKSSQMRDMYNHSVLQRRSINKLHNELRSMIKTERNGKALDSKIVENMTNDLQSELRQQLEGIRLAILLLQELIGDVEKTCTTIHGWVEKDHYPKGWAKKDIHTVEHMKELIIEWKNQEIEQARRFLSKIEHTDIR